MTKIGDLAGGCQADDCVEGHWSWFSPRTLCSGDVQGLGPIRNGHRTDTRIVSRSIFRTRRLQGVASFVDFITAAYALPQDWRWILGRAMIAFHETKHRHWCFISLLFLWYR